MAIRFGLAIREKISGIVIQAPSLPPRAAAWLDGISGGRLMTEISSTAAPFLCHPLAVPACLVIKGQPATFIAVVINHSSDLFLLQGIHQNRPRPQLTYPQKLFNVFDSEANCRYLQQVMDKIRSVLVLIFHASASPDFSPLPSFFQRPKTDPP